MSLSIEHAEMKTHIDLANWESFPDSYLFNVEEVAAILRCSENKVRTAVDLGYLKGTRLKGQGKGPGPYRIKKLCLVEYLDACAVQTVVLDPKKPPPQRGGSRFKHLRPTWLHASPPPTSASSRQPNGDSAPSSASKNAPSTQQ